MIVGTCTITLRLPGNASLKGKRAVLKSLTARLRQEFNISIAEIDSQDRWQEAVLGIACVSSNMAYVDGLLQRVVQWIEANRPDVEVLDYQIAWC
jgi:uncharacterized protein YlxP (DUF503 family)